MRIALKLETANVIAGKALERKKEYEVVKSNYSITEGIMVVLVSELGVNTDIEAVSYLNRVLFSTTESHALLLDKKETLVFV